MKFRLFYILFWIVSSFELYSQLSNRGCGTSVPSVQYDSLLQQKVIEYLNNSTASSRIQSTFQIPVIIHVIHNGQAVGTFPNLAQGQLNSQIQVLNDDYAGIGFNSANYPATAFQAYATNTLIAASSKDGLNRIGIANTGISFCLALKDSLGNTLPEPGIHRLHWNTISGASNPTTYTTAATFQNFMNTVVKPATIWSPNKYLNIWVTDINASAGLIGFSTFPPLSGLTGITGAGTATTDGLWCWAKVFGSQNIYSSGSYSSPYQYGRTATHELSHYFGLRHIWGDASCATDYCNDTPPAQGATYGTQSYPCLPNNCSANVPPTGAEGIMFMNFTDFTDDAGMYMFTDEQKIRMQTAMTNSPYRNQLGTHGFCSASSPTVVANFSLSASVINVGQSVNITDLSTSTATINSWNYICAAATPSSSILQNPSFTFNTPGTHTISLTITSSGVNASASKTIQVLVCPTPSVTANSVNPSCNGLCNGSITLNVSAAGGAPFTYSWTPAIGTGSVLTNLCAGTYSCIVTNSCGISATKIVTLVQPNPITLSLSVSNSSICIGNSTTLSSSVNGGVTPYFFSWSNGGTTATITDTPTIIPTTGYTLTVTDNQGCTKVNTVSVTVNPIPSITVTPHNPTICAGKTATVNLSGAASFTTNPGNIVTSTFTVNPSATTVYTMTGISPFGCVGTRKDTITVVNPPTIFSSVSSNTVCLGSSITFSNSGGLSYTLNPTSFTGNVINVSPTVLGTTIFTVSGSGPFGCINTKTISVNTFSLPVVVVSPSLTTICSGQVVSLNATGAGSYTWTTGSTLSSISVSPSASTSYSVIGKNSFGCENSAGAVVNVVNTPIVSINSPSTSVCFGYTMTATANGASSYNWSNGATTNTILVQSFSNISYSVVGTNGGSCADTAFLNITVLPLPSVSASASSTLVCLGQTVNLSATGNAVNYLWQPGNLFGSNHNVQITAPVTYTVYGQGSNGCAFLSTVFINAQTTSSVIPVSTPSAICVGDSSVLSVIGGTVPTWSANTIPNTNIVSPTTPTSYTLSAVDFNGCVSNIVFNVDINSNCDVIVYNGFTPNGDGLNDFWFIENIEKIPNNKVHIFNRWGNRIYNTVNYNNISNRWDGKTNSGSTIISGTYFFIILDENEKLLQKGWIEITN
ncbi:MAG: gliding motility-associated C-terminal domain-containing protein [Bacteroidia bacterium]